MQKLFRVISPGTFASTSDLSAAPAHPGLQEAEQNDPTSEKAPYTAAEDLLVVSPYTSRAHLLDLTLLNQAQILLAKALAIFTPVTHAYATSTYISSFNWDAVFSLLAASVKAEGLQWKEQFFYVIIFRSQVPPSTDRSDLAALDMKAHAEAMTSGGLLKYWFGTPDANGRNLATCIWRRREDAQPGSSGEGHKAAMRATINMYSEWQVERRKLIVGDSAEHWDIVPWTD
ncbi:MAG: hypothetical protein Q9166_000350 [cf. Caloplaca sp. 2 TL-2023]